MRLDGRAPRARTSGFGDSDAETSDCEAPEDTVEVAGDCDDLDATISPDGQEVCDGEDNDCDGKVDDADNDVDADTKHTYYADADHDGFGAADASVQKCLRPAGYTDEAGDCNDADRNIHPGANEVCDGRDNDCDDQTDDHDPDRIAPQSPVFYLDGDHDGSGSGAAVRACSRPGSHVDRAGDCDDTRASVNPEAREICDGLNNDCDVETDEGSAGGSFCDSAAANYPGRYVMTATEQVGSTIVNQMRCTGTSALRIDLAAATRVSGTMVCTRAGGLIRFDLNQSATFAGDVNADGVVRGRVTHVYNDELTRSFDLEGTVAGGVLTLTGTGSMYPHPQATWPWDVDVDVTAP